MRIPAPRRAFLRLVSVLLLSTMPVLCLAAEEQRRVCLSFSSPGLDAEGWSSSLEGALAASQRIGLVLRVPAGEDALVFAALHGCDLAVVVAARRAGGEGLEGDIAIEWKILQPLAGASGGEEAGASGLVAQDSYSAAFPDERRRATSFWFDLVEKVDAALSTLPLAGNAILTLSAPPGAHITGLGKDDVYVPGSGSLSLRLKAPATYHWTANATGLKTITGILNLLGPSTLRIDLPPRERFRLELGLAGAAFPDFRITWMPGPDWLYLRAGYWQYLSGINLSSAEEDDDNPLIVSYDLIEPCIGLGLLALKPDAPLRILIGVDAALRLMPASAADGIIDAVAPVRIGFYCGLEWNLYKATRLFFETGADYYPACNAVLLDASNGDDFTLPHIYGDNWYIELLSFRFGLRWIL